MEHLTDASKFMPLLITALWWAAYVFGFLFLAVFLAAITLRLLDFLRLLRQKYVFLELTPPANHAKTPEAARQLFSVLHGLEAGRSAKDKLLRRKVVFSLEIVSTKEQGIRYIARVAQNEAPVFEKTVTSYMPEVKVQRLDEFLPEGMAYRRVRVLEAKQTGHFAYPLHAQDASGQHDPMSYLTGAMTKLASGELMAMQLVVTPTTVPEARSISKRLLHNEELLQELGKQRSVFGKIFEPINAVLFSLIDGIGEVSGGSSGRSHHPEQVHAVHKQQAAMKIKPARTLSVFEQQLAESVHDKLSQPLFQASIRAVVATDSKQEAKQRAKGFKDWLAPFSVPGYQSLRTRRDIPAQLKGRYRLFLFQRRLPPLFTRNTCLFATSELADLYHFPHLPAAQAENMAKSFSKTLPAPVSLKNNPDLDVVLGQNHHHGTITNIGLTVAERERHVYIIGGTGNGKTTMLQYAAVQDIKNGKGLAVIDPHGDLAETLLRHIPEERVNDVVHFNPDDLTHPIGLNMLGLTPGLTGDELLREKDLVTESVISIFRKIFSEDDTGGHRIEYVLRNTIQTALTVQNATLFTVYDLLNDPKYRKKIVQTLENRELKNFWKYELGKAGGFQQVKMAAGITAKIGRFLFSASAKRILEQPKSTINFDEILDGKILICNFSKGLLGEDTSSLFGIAVLAKIQMAALRRARLKQADRKPFYLYVDEFQNFATPSFVQMLSEARKYKLSLTMAEQSTSQQDDQNMINVILANVGTILCFRSGNPADEKLMLPLFSPSIEEGEITNLPSFNFYMRISATKPQEPFSGETILLENNGDDKDAERAIEFSRKHNAKKYVEPLAGKPRKPNKQKRPGITLPDA
jgi:hypothetical protein